MITVKVPATSANVGAGFDALGLALNLFNTVHFELAEELSISSTDGTSIPTGTDNLVYRAAKETFEFCKRPVPPMRILQENPIPMARGLGSSSACIVAGILGANALMGSPLSSHEMLQLAAAIEGHPDNVAPALLGGFVASVMDEGNVYSVKKEISTQLEFAAFVPDFPLLTEESRGVLPKTIPYKDAVYNLSRAALATAAFCDGDYQLLQVATKDAMHQSYRLGLIPGGEEIFSMARELGALAVYISGAGPTIMAVVRKSDEAFFASANQWLCEQKQKASPSGAFAVHHLLAANHSAVVE